MPRAHRQERIADLLREHVASVLHEEFHAPEGCVLTVTDVHVADDLETAAVAVSVFPDTEKDETFERLEQFVGEVQYRLMKTLRIKPIPRIRFVPDKSVGAIDAVERTLRDIETDA